MDDGVQNGQNLQNTRSLHPVAARPDEAINEGAHGLGIHSPHQQPVTLQQSNLASARPSLIDQRKPAGFQAFPPSDDTDNAKRPGNGDSHGEIPIFLEVVGGHQSPLAGRTVLLQNPALHLSPARVAQEKPNRDASASVSPRTGGRLRSKFYHEHPASRAKSAAPSVFTPTDGSRVSSNGGGILPAANQETAYDPAAYRTVASRPDQRRNTNSATPGSSQIGSILSKLGSLHAPSTRRQSKYDRLADDNGDSDIALTPMRRTQVSQSRRHSHFDPIGIDISSFEGPAAMQRNVTRGQSMRRRDTEDPSEENKLEANGELTGGIGRGMGSVVETRLTIPLANQSESNRSSAHSPGWRKSLRRPSRGSSAHHVGQEAAERVGHVVAVEEHPNFDISHFEGPALGPNPSTDIELLADKTSKKSYFFPTNSQMPDWRPFPMHLWYVSFLVVIALVLAAVSEYLVQKSIQNGDGKGLLSFTRAAEVTSLEWFTWKYLPTMVLLLYGIMWQAVDFECRRLEPYYQLSRHEGALAAESLNMDYMTFFSYLIPFKAFRHGQWAVVLSSFATIFSSALIPVLSNGAVNVNPDRDQRAPGSVKWITFDPVWSRIMEVALLLVAVAGIWLVFQLRRKSGLQSDPKGVAGIAALATRSHILNDFRGLDTSSHNDIHRNLKRRRYILHKSSLWQGQYIMQTDKDRDEPRQRNPHPLALHLGVGIAYLVSLLVFIAMIPILEFTPANIVTEKANWFITLIAILIKLAWTNLETAIRMIEPYYILSRRHAPASVLRLDYTGTLPIYFPCRALLNKHYLVAAVGFGSVLTEILTVCVSSFNVDGDQFVDPHRNHEARQLGSKYARDAVLPSDDTDQTLTSFWTSLVLTELIPIVMLVTAAIVYARRRHAFLPRQPATIASALAFIHQSKMLYEFVSREEEEEEDPVRTWSPYSKKAFGKSSPGASDSPFRSPPYHQRSMDTLKFLKQQGGSSGKKHVDIAETTVRMLEQQGKTYGLGWYVGRDGEDHMGIDEEELVAGYEHGLDRKKGVLKDGIGNWDVF